MLSKSTIKYIQSLQHKKFRNEHQVFVAEGPKLVQELLTAGYFNCRNIYATEGWEPPAGGRLQHMVEYVKDFELQKISGLSTANQVLAIFDMRPQELPANSKGRLTLALDDIQDPGNLGTIIRIADWFGINTIICSLHTADLYNPKVVQSTMASLQQVHIVYTDLEEWLGKADVPVYAASLHGTSLYEVERPAEGILVIGNESKGISENILKSATTLVTIPRIGQAESLNAAVATGIILATFAKP